jgi:hypothetical protein
MNKSRQSKAKRDREAAKALKRAAKQAKKEMK